MSKKPLPKYRLERVQGIMEILKNHSVFETALENVKSYLRSKEPWRKRSTYFFNVSEIISLYGIWKDNHG